MSLPLLFFSFLSFSDSSFAAIDVSLLFSFFFRQDVVPLDKRHRPINQWDIPPPGCEHLSAMDVKRMGGFPVGGNSGPHFPHHRGHSPPPMPFFPPHHGSLPLPGGPLPLPGGMGGHIPLPVGVDPQSHIYRQAKRLYVGNLPEGVTEHSIAAFFNEVFAKNRMGNGEAVASVHLNREKNFAFVEVWVAFFRGFFFFYIFFLPSFLPTFSCPPPRTKLGSGVFFGGRGSLDVLYFCLADFMDLVADVLSLRFPLPCS